MKNFQVKDLEKHAKAFFAETHWSDGKGNLDAKIDWHGNARAAWDPEAEEEEKARRGKKLPFLDWQTKPPRSTRVKITNISPFSARGMRWVFGRGDHFPGQAAFNMDIWMNLDESEW
jgi:hypothetical protein